MHAQPRDRRIGLSFAPLRALTGMRWMRMQSLDFVGLTILLAGGVTILGNALFMQPGAHPAPMTRLAPPALPVPAAETTGSFAKLTKTVSASPVAAAPAPAERPRAQLLADIQRELGRRGFYDGAIDGIYGPRMDAAIRDFEQASGLRASGEPSEQLLRAIAKSNLVAKARATAQSPQQREPSSNARMVAIQRALSDQGYGQLKANGVLDGETRAAIEKFERDRRLPVTGAASNRLSRELAAVTGRPLD